MHFGPSRLLVEGGFRGSKLKKPAMEKENDDIDADKIREVTREAQAVRSHELEMVMPIG